MMREIDDRHPALSDLTDDLVLPAEDLADQRISHAPQEYALSCRWTSLVAMLSAARLACVMEIPVLLAMLLSAPPNVEAAREKASLLVEDALAAFEEGEYTRAASRYLEAYEVAAAHGLPAKPELLYNAGLAFDLAGRCDRAAELLETYHRSSKESAPQDLAERLTRAKECAPAVMVETTPRSAAVLVDGEPRGETPTELRMIRGERRVRFEREGYVALEETWEVPKSGLRQERRLELMPDRGELSLATTTSTVFLDGRPIAAGSVHAVTAGRHSVRFERPGCAPRIEELVIEPGRSTAVEPGPCISSDVEAERLEPSPWVWVSGGVGAAGLIGGITLAVLANEALARRDAELDKPDELASGRVVRDSHDEAVRLTVGSYVSFGVAAAGVAAGLLLLLLDRGASADITTEGGVVTMEW
jgi:hypothetical protein